MNPKKHTENPAWNVYLDGSFWKHPSHTDPCQEYPVKKSFYWGSEEWLIPSVYASFCHEKLPHDDSSYDNMHLKGIVIDFIKKVPADSIRLFIDKWNLHPDSSFDEYSQKQEHLIRLENPLTAAFTSAVTRNGSNLPCSQASSICWNPVYPEMNDKITQDALAHYRLDPAYGWVICRSSFLCHENDTAKSGLHTNTIQKSGLPLPAAAADSLSVRLLPEKQEIPGPHFHINAPGSRITFTHPQSGRQHTLTVQEYSQQRMEHTAIHSPEKMYPCCYALLGYTIHPALSPDRFMLIDCAKSDRPRTLPHLQPDVPAEYADSDIIGGADGPTALILSVPSRPDRRYAASAVHFEPVNDTEWEILFLEPAKTEICIDLL